jgi:MacB-like periplasmic core domain
MLRLPPRFVKTVNERRLRLSDGHDNAHNRTRSIRRLMSRRTRLLNAEPVLKEWSKERGPQRVPGAAVEDLINDLKHSLRMFRQSPAFTMATVAALALGIGANTAIFAVVNAVLLRPVPYPGSERIVMFMNTAPQGSGPGASPAKFFHWRGQTTVVEDVSAFRTGLVNYTGGESPQQLRSGQVSADFFRLFGAPIAVGRTLLARRGPSV